MEREFTLGREMGREMGREGQDGCERVGKWEDVESEKG